MWRPFGTRRTTLKQVDPISLVNSAVRERAAKADNNDGYKVKPLQNIPGADEAPLKVSNKSFTLNHLVTGLSKDDYLFRIKALRGLPELLENPLYAEVAIDLKIVERLALLQKRLEKRLLVARANEESLILNLLHLLSTYLNAAKQMASEQFLIGSLYKMMRIMHTDQHIAANILKNISEKPESLQILMKIPRILRMISPILQRELCTTYYPSALWEHIQHVLNVNPDKGVQEHFMETFMHRIKLKITDFHLDNMKCLGILLKSSRGKSQFQAFEGIKLFYDLLKPNTDNLNDYEPLLDAFKNALYNNPSLIEDCSKFKDLPEILAKMAKHTEKARVQTLSFYILNYLTTREDIRKVALKTCRKTIISTKSLSKEAEYYKLALKCCLNQEKMNLQVSGIMK